MSNEREATERVVSRMYKHHLKSTGKLPDGKEIRNFESEAQKAGQRVDNKKKRR